MKLFALPIFFFAFTIIHAQQLTPADALKRASEQLERQGLMKKDLVKSARYHDISQTRSLIDASAPYYLFEINNGKGFIIASGDARLPSVIGYSEENAMDAENMPDALKDYLDDYAKIVGSLPEDYGSDELVSFPNVVIEPLIKTEWNQGSLYAKYTPMINGSQCVTGCVATALAQIVNYYKYPELLPALDGYKTIGQARIEVPAIPEHTINWNGIIHEQPQNDEEWENVAWLMRYVGQALHNDYDYTETPGHLNGFFLKSFGYNKYAKYVYRNETSHESWVQTIIDELQAKRPVYTLGGAHAYICDGYDGNGNFHINWGWGGSYNGYFNFLNDDIMMIRHRPAEIVVGISPTESDDTFILDARLGTVGYLYAYYTFLLDRQPYLTDYFNEVFGDPEIALAVEKEEGSYDVLDNTIICASDVDYSGYIGLDYENNRFDYLPDGTYKLVGLCRESQSSGWALLPNTKNTVQLVKKGDNQYFEEQAGVDLTVNTIGSGNKNQNFSLEILLNNNCDHDEEVRLDVYVSCSYNHVNVPISPVVVKKGATERVLVNLIDTSSDKNYIKEPDAYTAIVSFMPTVGGVQRVEYKYFNISDEDVKVDGIYSLDCMDNMVFNLQGQRVNGTTDGFRIKNNKIVINK